MSPKNQLLKQKLVVFLASLTALPFIDSIMLPIVSATTIIVVIPMMICACFDYE